MARGVNKVILIGNLGNDPEVRYTPNGNAVANVTIATSTVWRDKQSGELQERTEWHRVAFFNRLAEIVGEYLRKGSKIYVDGSLRTRKWTDKTGNERYTTEIIANEMQMLDSRTNSGGGSGSSGSSGSSDNYQGGNKAPATPAASGNTNTPSSGSTSTTTTPPEMTDFEDDIPF